MRAQSAFRARAVPRWRILFLALFAVSAPGLGPIAAAQDRADHAYFTDDFQVTEGQGSARISVARDSAAGPLTVGYETRSSDATEGADYTPVRGQLHFPAGDRGPKTFEVPIADDGEPEDEEGVLLLLLNEDGNPIDFAELAIISNEPGDEVPGEVAGEAAIDDADPGGVPADARRNSGRAGTSSSPPGGQATTPPPASIPTIVLEAAPETSDPAVVESRARPLARPREEQSSGNPLLTLSAYLIALLVAAGGLALLWRKLRVKGPRLY